MTLCRLGRRLGILAASTLSVAAVFSSQNAHGYAIEMHYQLALRALDKDKGGLQETAAPLNLVAAAAVRSAIDGWARSGPEAEAWKKRYPTPNDFDDWAMKQMLLLEPTAKVYGIDRLDPRATPTSKLYDLVAMGSRHPDEDWRNRERVAYDTRREPRKGPGGGPLPADPAVLNMGKLGALSSQAHAHYGLAQVELSPEAEVLKTEPRRFARRVGFERAPVLTLAAEMAQEHLDMSLLAGLSDAPSGRELAWLYTGQGFHYLQDIGNQIHTVQVGLYDFFVDGFTERLKLGLLTGGGYFGEMRSLGSIGIDILTNHHTLSEMWTEKRFREAVAGGGTPESQVLYRAPSEDDPEFAALLDKELAKLGPNPEKAEFGQVITRTLIEASSHEGDDVYRVTRKLADPKLRTRSGKFDDEKDDPDLFMRPKTAELEASYTEFYALQARAFRRVGTAERRWVALEQKALEGANTPEARSALRTAVAERLVKRQLRMLGEAEARLADYERDPPSSAVKPERAPELLAADLGIAAAVLGIAYLIFRRRKK